MLSAVMINRANDYRPSNSSRIHPERRNAQFESLCRPIGRYLADSPNPNPNPNPQIEAYRHSITPSISCSPFSKSGYAHNLVLFKSLSDVSGR